MIASRILAYKIALVRQGWPPVDAATSAFVCLTGDLPIAFRRALWAILMDPHPFPNHLMW